MVRSLLAAGDLAPSDIAVVTPYVEQVQLMERSLVEALGAEAAEAVEVSSVDGFQGREKEVIVFSAVRSNKRGTVGFLSDRRRLNVMLTRPRRGLVVVGDRDTLAHDTTWKAWLEWADGLGVAVQGGAWR